MFSRVYLALTCLLALSLLLGMVGVAQAAPGLDDAVTLQETVPPPCSNLDVIFIVDQSDSMSGNNGAQANDPTRQRKYAVEGMIDLLVDLATNQCPDSNHRVGVISFGRPGSARIDIELATIDPATSADGRNIREELKPRVQADALGSTYPEQAFIEAEKMFSRHQVNEREPRKQVIIFITDGLPCEPGRCEGANYHLTTSSLRNLVNDLFDFSNDLQQREECLAGLREQYGEAEIPGEETTTCLESNPVADDSYSNSTYIFTILLHNSDEANVASALGQLRGMSQDYAGELKELNQNRNQIPSTLREILSQLAGVRPSLLACGSFAVNPYLNKMIITAYKASEEIELTLSYADASGTTHIMQGGQPTQGFTLAPDTGYYQFGTNETYTFINPYPGIWNLSTSNCDGIDVYYEAIDAVFQESVPFSQRPQYDRAPFYYENNPFYLEFGLRDNANNGEIVAQSDKTIFAIDVQATVTDPAQNEIVYPLKWDFERQTFRAEQPLQVPLAGTYLINIVGTTRRHEGESIVDSGNEAVVFDKTYTLFNVEGEFTGLNVTPFEIASTSPASGESIGNVHGTILDGWPLRVNPLPVRVRIVDEAGNTLIDPNSILNDPTASIEAQLTYLPTPEPGREEIPVAPVISEPIMLQPDPEKPGEFFGEFPDFGYEGQHTLTLNIPSDKVKEGYWPYSQQVNIDFSRTDCLFCRAGTYYLLLAAIIIAIAALIFYNIAIRTNKIAGTLIFVDGSERIAEFGLYSGTNVRKFKKRELDAFPQLMLKSMKARNIGKKRRAAKQEEELTGGFYPEDEGIRIECVTSSGNKIPVDLHPRIPTPYNTEETFAQMVYEPVE